MPRAKNCSLEIHVSCVETILPYSVHARVHTHTHTHTHTSFWHRSRDGNTNIKRVRCKQSFGTLVRNDFAPNTESDLDAGNTNTDEKYIEVCSTRENKYRVNKILTSTHATEARGGGSACPT